MVRNWKVLSFIVNRAQVLYKAISEPQLGLTNVEEATSGAADAVDYIGGSRPEMSAFLLVWCCPACCVHPVPHCVISDYVGRCAGEPLPDMKGFFGSLDGDEVE
eukprot:g23578.t1